MDGVKHTELRSVTLYQLLLNFDEIIPFPLTVTAV
jgi:hypothetical protein